MLFFTSDQHFGDDMSRRFWRRPYRNVEEMDRCLIDGWNDTVRPTDEVWCLGDVAIAQASHLRWAVGQLHGRKYLIAGNHDACWAGHRRHTTTQNAWWHKTYESCGLAIRGDPFGVARLADEQATLSHFPYRDPDRHDFQFESHMPDDRGGWLIHGHVHTRWRQWGRMINVSVDAWDFRPVAADRLEAIIRAGPADIAIDGHSPVATPITRPS